MKPKSQIIAEQESIGNVEIGVVEYCNLKSVGEFMICFKDNKGLYEELFFAPRDVVYPDEKIGCGVKIMSVNGKDIKCGEVALGKIRYCNHCHSCQEKKDNHSSEITAHLESKDEEPENLTQEGISRLEKVEGCKKHPKRVQPLASGSDIQSSKIFEDVYVNSGFRFKVDGNLLFIINKANPGLYFILDNEEIKRLNDAVNYYQEKWGKI